MGTGACIRGCVIGVMRWRIAGMFACNLHANFKQAANRFARRVAVGASLWTVHFFLFLGISR